MRPLEDGQLLQTESMEFASEGLIEVDPSGPVIWVGGSKLLLLETRQDVKWLSHAAMTAQLSSSSIEEQEAVFLEIISRFPSEPPPPINQDQIEIFLKDTLEPQRDLTPLETLVSGCEGLASLMEYPTFSDTSVGIVFAWQPENDDRPCRVAAHDELPMLILDHGSLSIALLKLKGLYTASKWMLAGYGWVRPNFTSANEAANWYVNELRSRAFKHGHGAMPLDRLDHPNAVQTFNPDKHSMALVYVHGLFSTDAGSFDGFRDAWSSLRINLYTDGALDRRCVESVFDKVGHIGFPHDTFCGIDKSGQALADALHDRFEASDTKLALIAHSRGGLVTRRAIQHLLFRGNGWNDRIKIFATFGTPHTGAKLAQLPGRYEGSYLLLKGQSDQLIALDMLFCYLKHVRRIEGIDDLQPVGNLVSTFLEDLEDRENKYGSLSTWAVSGAAPQISGWGIRSLITKAVRIGIDQIVGSPNDIVVPRSSAEAAPNPTVRKFDCEHFEYFSQLDGMKNTAREVMRAFGLEDEINICTGGSAPDIEFIESGDDTIVRIGGIDLPVN
ncbi:hypothetical protein FIU89_16915 [Roseovarius sp. THAF27]|uniref:esterase/lipase family protein n=1 Tax=Roseovarius sp. THAF27 TaxID=2587850 RepID=UPI001268FCA2|nr:hypothetical protein [Roseovarius sp. THAF27]QFT82309.1 hypothetical protein FIU89_16915 [Roseovarius sp. THAF27]